MPLPREVEREPVHQRDILCRGFKRRDGLWDIEGRLTDTKSYPFSNAWRGTIEPGEPLHDMWLRLTVDDQLTVRDVAAASDAVPFAICPAITPAFKKLIGLTIGPGWRREVRARVGGVQGCTHLVELLGPLATTAFQTVLAARTKETKDDGEERVPGHLDSCHALRRDGPVVRKHYSKWYRQPSSG
ncbi:MAG: DUF2889 domain-containing protein [Geminicoccaceae bacterium]